MKASFEHIIPAPIEKVLETFKSKEFYESKQLDSGATNVECLSYDDDGGGKIRMSHRCSEPSRLPKFLRKSSVDTYTDDSVLDMETKILTWKVTPEVGADKFSLSGRIVFTEMNDQTKLTFEATMEVKVPLVGKKAEKLGLSEMKNETSKQATFIKNWIASH